MKHFPDIDIAKTRQLFHGIDFIENEFAIFDNLGEGLPIGTFRLNFCLLALCIEGNVEITVDNKETRLTTRQMLLLMPGCVASNATQECKGMFIAISPAFMDEVLPKLDRILPLFFKVREHPCVSVSETELHRLREVYNFLRKSVQYKAAYRKEIARNLLKVLFYEISAIFGEHVPVDKHTGRRDELFSHFLELLAANFRNERSLAFYTGKMCISQKYLSQVVKRVSARTASDWISDYVVTEAKTLLRNSKLSIQEIAFELNFTNQSFFAKFFKRATGMPPRDFRRS